MSVKEITKNGKTKFQAQVWYAGQFFGSKTFDQKHLAQQWQDLNLKAAEAGSLVSPASRKAQRAEEVTAAKAKSARDAALQQTLSQIATRLVEDQAQWRSGKLGKKRNEEIKLAARYAEEILGPVPIQDFHGAEGVERIKRLAPELYWVRRCRRGKGRGASSKPTTPSKPLADQTVRLLLTALAKLLRYARKCIPADVPFDVPNMESDQEFGWALPPAHGKPRTRIVEDAELAAVLRAAGQESPLGVLLQILDETGCRLGEVSSAYGSQLTFFHDESGVLFGGSLHLFSHKTMHKTHEERDVPLSAAAAKLFLDRKNLHGNGPLFPSFRDSSDICKQLEAVCERAQVRDLASKDLRRGFLNRNKYSTSELDMRKIFGDSAELNLEETHDGTKAVQDAFGHKKLSTTKGYVVPHLQKLAVRFTATSRHVDVMRLVGELEAKAPINVSAAPKRRQPRLTGGEFVWTPPSEQVIALAEALGVSLTAAMCPPDL